MSHIDHTAYISCNQLKIACLQRTDVDDHINFRCALSYGGLGFECLGLWSRCTQRKPDHRTDFDWGSPQELRAQTHPGGVNTYRGKIMFARFKAKLGNFLLGGVRFEQGMIDHLCQTEVAWNHSQRRCQPL